MSRLTGKDALGMFEAYQEIYSTQVEQVEEAQKWIQKAIKKPGALHKQLGVPAGKKIPAGKLAAAAEKGGKLGKRARLAQTLAGFHEEVDIFDIVLEFLQAEGYAETLEEAQWLMANELNAEDIDAILGEGMTKAIGERD